MITYLLHGDEHSSFENTPATEVIEMVSTKLSLTDMSLDVQTESATVYSSATHKLKVIQFEDIIGSFNYVQGISKTDCCNAVEIFFQNQKIACSNCGAPVSNLFSTTSMN